MRFTKIDLANIRAIDKAILHPGPGINLLYGNNGSGKTSVLEAIHLLSRGKSFRTPKIDELVRRNQAGLTVSSQLEDQARGEITTGLKREQRKTKLVFNQNQIKSQSEQAANLPIIVQTTDSHSLVFGVPKQRRKWLDWLMFHVKPGYLSTWKQYHHALRNRNMLLRKGARGGEIEAWEQQLAKSGSDIIQQCQDMISQVAPHFSELTKTLLGGNGEVSYRPGWDLSLDYQEILEQERSADIERGYTKTGPHRADIEFTFDQQKASRVLSRGQAKLFIASLMLSEVRVFVDRNDKSPVLLIDDVAAELDQESRNKIVAELNLANIQSFITTTEPEMFDVSKMTVFHVKQGQINMVKS